MSKFHRYSVNNTMLKYQRREKRHFSVIRFTPEGNHKGDNSVSETSQVGQTIYPRLSGKTQHCE